jgi:F0F1-type ATP synthase membrane subunit c/vacuolar-type H+-ATPase subunit K
MKNQSMKNPIIIFAIVEAVVLIAVVIYANFYK